MGHGVGEAPRTGHLGDRSVSGAPEKPELKGREILLQASQPDLEGEVGREKREAASPHLNQETGCLEVGFSNSYLLSSQV